MNDLIIDHDEIFDILTDFIKSETNRAGFSRAVVGLSGGIDSSLSCFLAAEALGPDNVMAVRMPYKNSSSDSLEHAQMVIDQLGVRAITVPITQMAEHIFTLFPQAGQLRRGNVMARIRMTVLFDQSRAFNGLVVGTGNKTELLLGYTTIYGDSACAFNPLGDLYKTQIRQLATAIGVPREIVDKPPSADLWAGQTDEGELGFTYEEVDKLLFSLVEKRHTPQQCLSLGFSEDFINKVVERVRKSQFKRSLPSIPKLSDVTVWDNLDFIIG